MDTPHTSDGKNERQGVSNRETSAQEEMERQEHPPLADEEPQSRPHKAPTHAPDRDRKPQ